MDMTVFLQMFTFLSNSLPIAQNFSSPTSIISTTTTATTPATPETWKMSLNEIKDISPKFWVIFPKSADMINTTTDCRGVYGCFPTGYPWESFERPVSLPPSKFQDIHLKFCLFSKTNDTCKNIPIDVEKVNLDGVAISSSSHLVVIIHGFALTPQNLWMESLSNTLLENYGNDLHVLLVDWEAGARLTYAQSVANTRFVGAIVGWLLKSIMDVKGLKSSHTHLVGHSLGAHLSGYAGSYLSKHGLEYKLGRITGMDPAGPYFSGTSPEVHLDASDAFIVDILHTDATPMIPTLPVSLGLSVASGHLDFFPNGGEEQSGCGKSPQGHILAEKDIGKGIREYLSCNHERSHRYFASSAARKCMFVGVECSSWTEYKRGRCWNCNVSRCFRMGFELGRVYPSEDELSFEPETKEGFGDVVLNGESHITVYLATTDNENICGNQLRFTIVTSNADDALESGGEYAKFSLVLRGEEGTAEIISGKEVMYVMPGDRIMWVESVPHIGNLTSIVFHYTEEKNLLNPLFWRFTPPTLYLQELVVEGLLSYKRKVFPFCQKSLSSGQTVILRQQHNCQDGTLSAASSTAPSRLDD